MIPVLNPYKYHELTRVTRDDGKRYYVCPDTGDPLPSVTTILDGTANKDGIKLWEQRVGKAEADKVRKEATALGSLMHGHLEDHILGRPRNKGMNRIHQMARQMADVVIGSAHPQIDEVWGIEVTLHMPTLYAGTTDLIGVFNGRPAIMDYKTTRGKLKEKKSITDYFDQLAAYSLSHDELYGTDIQTGVIFMCNRAHEYTQFVIEGDEFRRHKESFLNRVETFFAKVASGEIEYI